MVNQLKPLTVYQWGQEATRGTAVAATSKMLMAFEPEEEDAIERPNLALGYAIAHRGNEFHVMNGTKFTIPAFPLNYEQLPALLNMAVAIDAAPTGADPYTWTHTPSLTADPALAARTLERRLTGGGGNIDDEWAYAMLSELEISWEAGRPIMVSASGFARKRQDSTLTAAQTAPTPEHIPSHLLTAFIDDDWASLGGSQVLGQMLNGSWKIVTGLKPYSAADGRTDLDFSSHEFDPNIRLHTLNFRLLVKNSGQYSTERTAAEETPPTVRAVRLRAAGTSSRQLTIDGLYTHERGSYQKIDEIDGQDVIDVSMIGTTDGTNHLSVELINKVATLV